MIINKNKLLQNLSETYCSFGVSKVEGVGVFAIRDIPKGINPFPIIVAEQIIPLEEKDLLSLPVEIAEKIKQLIVRCDKRYFMYNLGLNNMGIRFHVNHSKNPNLTLHTPQFKNSYASFKTTKKIKKGEELFYDYSTSGGDSLKKQFKFLK